MILPETNNYYDKFTVFIHFTQVAQGVFSAELLMIPEVMIPKVLTQLQVHFCIYIIVQKY